MHCQLAAISRAVPLSLHLLTLLVILHCFHRAERSSVNRQSSMSNTLPILSKRPSTGRLPSTSNQPSNAATAHDTRQLNKMPYTPHGVLLSVLSPTTLLAPYPRHQQQPAVRVPDRGHGKYLSLLLYLTYLHPNAATFL